VKTTRASRGMSTSMFFRLCSRAPRTCTNPLAFIFMVWREWETRSSIAVSQSTAASRELRLEGPSCSSNVIPE